MSRESGISPGADGRSPCWRTGHLSASGQLIFRGSLSHADRAEGAEGPCSRCPCPSAALSYRWSSLRTVPVGTISVRPQIRPQGDVGCDEFISSTVMSSFRRTTRLASVPILVSSATAFRYGLRATEVRTRPSRRPVIAGVNLLADRTELLRVPSWADDEWFTLRTKVAALQLRRPDAVLSHVAATRFLGWPVSRSYPVHPIDVTPSRSNVSIVGFRSHRVKEVPSTTEWGITVAEPSEVLRQISAVFSEAELVAVIDALCGPWSGPADEDLTPERIQRVIDDGRMFPGSRRLRRALGRARPGVGSPRETWLRLELVSRGLPEPVVGHAVMTPIGELSPDLAFVDAKVALEYEGDQHRSDDWQFSHDLERANAFQAADWFFIRVGKRMSTSRIVALVSSALDR